MNTKQTETKRFSLHGRWPLLVMVVLLCHCGERAAFARKGIRAADAETTAANDTASDADIRATGNATTEQEPPTAPAPKDDEKDTTWIPTSPPPVTDIEFGVNEVYHLGDNAFGESSCFDEIREFPVIGAEFFFQFEVLEDFTKVTASINKICGVDYSDLNFVGIVLDETPTAPLTTLAVGQTQFNLDPVTLQKGRYAIYVASTANPDNDGDFDDFIVGQIVIKGDKTIQPLDIVVPHAQPAGPALKTSDRH